MPYRVNNKSQSNNESIEKNYRNNKDEILGDMSNNRILESNEENQLDENEMYVSKELLNNNEDQEMEKEDLMNLEHDALKCIL